MNICIMQRYKAKYKICFLWFLSFFSLLFWGKTCWNHVTWREIILISQTLLLMKICIPGDQFMVKKISYAIPRQVGINLFILFHYFKLMDEMAPVKLNLKTREAAFKLLKQGKSLRGMHLVYQSGYVFILFFWSTYKK